LSLVDFTDSANPKEIGYFDRGPISSTSLVLGGLWSTYYYNGHIYGTEIARGFDVFRLTPTTSLSQEEIDDAAQPVLSQFNAQLQSKLVVFDWEGFLATFDNPPALNETDSSNVQTFWFRLGGDRGLNVLAASSPASRQIDCSTKAPLGDWVAAQTPSWGSLSYQSYTQRYSYPWKPPKGNDYRGTCRELKLTLTNGSSHSVWLNFVK
jgi:hypothetical protein